MWLTTAKASGQGASSQVKVTATLSAFVELSKFGWKRILGDRSSDLNIHKHCFRSTCTAVFCPCTALFCPLEEVFLSSTEGNRFLIIPSWNAGKTFLLQLYRTRRWINQIYSTCIQTAPCCLFRIDKLLDLELKINLMMKQHFPGHGTHCTANIFQIEPASDFFLNQGSQVYFSRY